MALREKADYKAQIFIADGTIRAKRLVIVGSDDHHVAEATVTGATEYYRGVAMNGVTIGENVVVAYKGVVEVDYGGTITAGQAICGTTDGKAVATTSDGDRIVGYATVGGSDGETGCVRLKPSIL
jgi:hypothetical protein